MRPTLSQDNNYRATIQIEFRIGLDDLILAAIAEINDREDCYGLREDPTLWLAAVPGLSRTKVERRLRKLLRDKGDDYYWNIVDEIRPRDESIIAAITEKVTLLFPEFPAPIRHEQEAARAKQ